MYLGVQAGEKRIQKVVNSSGFRHFRRATQTPFNLAMRQGHNTDRPSISAGVGRPTQWTPIVSAHSRVFLFAPTTHILADRTVTRPPVVTG